MSDEPLDDVFEQLRRAQRPPDDATPPVSYDDLRRFVDGDRDEAIAAQLVIDPRSRARLRRLIAADSMDADEPIESDEDSRPSLRVLRSWVPRVAVAALVLIGIKLLFFGADKPPEALGLRGSIWVEGVPPVKSIGVEPTPVGTSFQLEPDDRLILIDGDTREVRAWGGGGLQPTAGPPRWTSADADGGVSASNLLDERGDLFLIGASTEDSAERRDAFTRVVEQLKREFDPLRSLADWQGVAESVVTADGASPIGIALVVVRRIP